MRELQTSSRFMALGLVLLLSLAPVSAWAGWGDVLKKAQDYVGASSSLSDTDIVKGLKEALEIGTANAVKTVSAAGGYYDNPQIRIPLPENVQKVEKVLRTAGYGAQVDAFDQSMNRAAEAAAPQAKAIFWDAIKQMSFDDARKILDGPENAATQYFEDKASPRLREVFKPQVHDAMAQVGVTRDYQALNERLSTLPFTESLSFDLDQYVTDKALDGLFHMLAEQEAQIRTNPAARTTDLLKKVFAGQ